MAERLTICVAMVLVGITLGIVIRSGIGDRAGPRCVYHFKDSNGTMQSIGSVCHRSWWGDK